ncbi:helix-turn-helix domain-containing protein [Acinetobacter ursingii]|uniref:helix-turn-helix domain-containing protein n=1 Tax=Acinetobacter ursingii TaxID=108980 RepID=UPI0021CDC6FA|nr:helix-turn-helix domain-containing protein [Acinetobacter ursingii]MCU4481334.1 helix-turn-helix domain-containing protein [Acinetobacter ursingii]MCU4505666.1 helix-turn-helix domain-containing protein [Acinetobacter ursingii]MCU4569612.1 helix-turn-helix domain-containing protein [Acinetobacter ursingii]
MSLDATKWAWEVQFTDRKGGSLKPLKRLVLLSLADRAGEEHTCYPSVKRLEDDTNLDRKTVMKIIAELIEDGFIADTGERTGKTKQVKIYKLIGVLGRENKRVPTTGYLPQESTNLKGTNIGTVPTTEQYHCSEERVPTIPLNSTNVGTRNLPKNLSEESKNKKTWLCLKKLREEIAQADPDLNPDDLIQSSWFEREQNAFERFNESKNLCDDLMIYHFADWLLNAKCKYQSREQTQTTHQGTRVQLSSSPKHLTDKQITAFSQKLAHHPEFAGFFAHAGESYEQLSARIAVMLSDPAKAKQWEKYLKQVGFSGVLGAAA